MEEELGMNPAYGEGVLAGPLGACPPVWAVEVCVFGCRV